MTTVSSMFATARDQGIKCCAIIYQVVCVFALCMLLAILSKLAFCPIESITEEVCILNSFIAHSYKM